MEWPPQVMGISWRRLKFREGGSIWKSKDGGNTWVPSPYPPTSTAYWQGVASSGDGTKVVGVIQGEGA